MIKALTTMIKVVGLCSLGLFFVACELVFSSPPQGEPAAVEPYIGRWRVVEYLTLPPSTPTTATFALQPDGQLGINVERSGEEPLLHLGRLIDVNGLAVMAFTDHTESWQLLNLVLEDGGNRLVLRIPSLNIVRRDVGAGILAGETHLIDRDDKLTIVSADGASLTQYIAEQPGFFIGAYAILMRE